MTPSRGCTAAVTPAPCLDALSCRAAADAPHRRGLPVRAASGGRSRLSRLSRGMELSTPGPQCLAGSALAVSCVHTCSRAAPSPCSPKTERQSHYIAGSLPSQFDAVIHVDDTDGARPAPRRSCASHACSQAGGHWKRCMYAIPGRALLLWPGWSAWACGAALARRPSAARARASCPLRAPHPAPPLCRRSAGAAGSVGRVADAAAPRGGRARDLPLWGVKAEREEGTREGEWSGCLTEPAPAAGCMNQMAACQQVDSAPSRRATLCLLPACARLCALSLLARASLLSMCCMHAASEVQMRWPGHWAGGH